VVEPHTVALWPDIDLDAALIIRNQRLVETQRTVHQAASSRCAQQSRPSLDRRARALTPSGARFY
jgi:hypothetical protein